MLLSEEQVIPAARGENFFDVMKTMTLEKNKVLLEHQITTTDQELEKT